MTFTQFAEHLHSAGIKSFWGEVKRRKAISDLPDIDDLAAMTADQIHALAQRIPFSLADLEAGYRTLCAARQIPPAWPPRVYP